jgi:CHAT domain-containing protein
LRPFNASIGLHTVLWTLARAAAADGLVHAALNVQNEDVAVAGRIGRGLDAIEARLSRARILAATGDTTSAVRDVAAARAGVARLPAGAVRDWFETDLRLAEVAVAHDRPARTAATLDSVIAFYSRIDNPVRLLPALLAHARALLAMGNVQGASADLDSAAVLLDVRRAEIAAEPLRASLLDAAHGIFDRLIMLRIAAGRPREALAYAERGRVSLAPVSRTHRWRRTDLAAPPGEVVVDYALVGDTLLTWTIEGKTVHLERHAIDRDRLAQTIERTRAALELRSGGAALRADLAALYDWLVRPVEARLGRAGTPLVLVADGDIAGVPFAALYDTRRRRYLVEGHAIRFVPSLRDAPREGSSSPASAALFVADPAFDRTAFPAFAPLPGAAAEVEALAALYEHPVVLTGSAANRARVERALQRATVFHYAGHAVYDDERPDASFLALATTAHDVGRLTATEVSELDLRHVRLVVLSACQTMHARRGRSGGFAGLSGAFLAAGAHGVVGSLWRVDDALTRALMIDFHRAYRASGDGAAALRTAQLGFLHSSDPLRRSPAAWAGFRYAGH